MHHIKRRRTLWSSWSWPRRWQSALTVLLLLAAATHGQAQRNPGVTIAPATSQLFEAVQQAWQPDVPTIHLFGVQYSSSVGLGACRELTRNPAYNPWDCLDQVILESEVSDDVTHYRASEHPSFHHAEWRPYAPSVFFTLERELGLLKTKTIYFQVRAPKPQMPLLPNPNRVNTPNQIEDPRSVLDKRPGSQLSRPTGPVIFPDLYAYSVPVSFDYSLPVITIASIGDSYASGEGTPNPTEPLWQSEQCHRSDHNGRVLAVEHLRQTYVDHVILVGDFACSGSMIDQGLLGEFRGVEGGPPLPPQVDQVETWLDALNMPLDALLISVGGDDIGFSKIVRSCLTPNLFGGVGCNQDDALHKKMQRGDEDPKRPFIGFDGLPQAYKALNAAITAQLDPRHVLITEYPDLTRDENGDFGGCDVNCHDESESITGDHLVNAPPPPEDFLGASMLDLHVDETKWVFNHVIVPLNEAVHQAACAHDWHYVGGMMEATRHHGLFSTSRWFNTIVDSWVGQRDYYGIFHPNILGSQAYAGQIVDVLSPLLEGLEEETSELCSSQ